MCRTLLDGVATGLMSTLLLRMSRNVETALVELSINLCWVDVNITLCPFPGRWVDGSRRFHHTLSPSYCVSYQCFCLHNVDHKRRTKGNELEIGHKSQVFRCHCAPQEGEWVAWSVGVMHVSGWHVKGGGVSVGVALLCGGKKDV